MKPPDEVTEAARSLLADEIAAGWTLRRPWTYTDESGKPLFYRVRLNPPAGSTDSKMIRPIYHDGTRWKLGEPKFPHGQKPLYKLHEIVRRVGEPVWIVEGEKCADELMACGVLATTSGSATSAGGADWSILAGRSCILWPDYDEPGTKYLADVVDKLQPLGCALEVIDVVALGLPEGGDAYDWSINFEERGGKQTAAALDALPRRPKGTGPSQGAPSGSGEGVPRSTIPAANEEDDSDSQNEPISLYDEERKKRNEASLLTEIGKRHDLFHDRGGDAYARVPIGDGIAIFAIEGKDYREVLSRDYYRLRDKGATRNGMSEALATIAAIAKHDRGEEAVYLRVGEMADGIVIDSGDTMRTCYAVTAAGWRATTDRIVNFRRSGKPRAMPTPGKPDFSLIWHYVNVSEPERVLIAAWLLSALRPKGPYPILLLIGEQGSGKSFATRIFKKLTDPSDVPLRAPPKDERDLLVAARSSRVLALDNLSGASAQTSDALCRLATGGGFSARQLYTDIDEVLIDIQRPVILNGIDDLASRPDLAQRCIHITMPMIRGRATEQDLNADFERDAGAIFSALLDAVALALKEVDRIHISNLPRMADFAKWAAAGIPALGFSSEDFINAYAVNQAEAVEQGLESSAVARAVVKLAQRERRWIGAASALLSCLSGCADLNDTYQQSWPRSPKGLLNALRRFAPSLRQVGVTYELSRDTAGRYVTLTHSPVGQASYPT